MVGVCWLLVGAPLCQKGPEKTDMSAVTSEQTGQRTGCWWQGWHEMTGWHQDAGWPPDTPSGRHNVSTLMEPPTWIKLFKIIRRLTGTYNSSPTPANLPLPPLNCHPRGRPLKLQILLYIVKILINISILILILSLEQIMRSSFDYDSVVLYYKVVTFIKSPPEAEQSHQTSHHLLSTTYNHHSTFITSP